MKKGDLVLRKPNPDDFYYIPDFKAGIVLTDPYAAVFTKQDESGEAVFSFEKIVVDILADNKIIHKCPTEFIVRTDPKTHLKQETKKL